MHDAKSQRMKKGGDILKSISVLHRERSRRPGLQMLITVSLFLLVPLLIPAVSPAVSITGESNTYLQSRQASDGTKELPLYEYLNFAVQDLGKESISFQFGGWLRYNLKKNNEEPDLNRSDEDLSYAYLGYRSSSANTAFKLGRVMVFEGVASERVDGLYARTDLGMNFGASAFGGSPVETGTDLPGENSIYGGRLSHQVPGVYQIGLSALKQKKDSADFRKEEGIDLWLKPINKVELLGKSRYNDITSAWSDHSYFLVLGPFEKVTLNTDLSKINYKDYFTGTTTSVFKFDPAVIDQNEKVSIIGEQVAYSATNSVNLSVDYKAYSYEVAGNAKYYGGNIRYAVEKSHGAGFSIHKMDGDTDRLRYTEYRAYGYNKMGKADITLDLLYVEYGAEINGVKDASTVTLAAAYELTERMKVGADAEYSVNPDYDKDIRTFVKLSYSFDTAGTHAEAPVSRPQEEPKAAPAQPAVDQGTPAVAPVQPATPPAAEQGAPATAPVQETPKPVMEKTPATTPEQSSPKPAPEQSSPAVAPVAPAPQPAAVEKTSPAAAPVQSSPATAPEQGQRKEGAQ